MAQINFFDDIFDTVSKTDFCNKKLSVKKLVDNYIEEKGDNAQLFEVYNAETDTTEFKVVTISSYKVIVIINGEEGNLDYVIEKDDVISIFFIPESKEGLAGYEIGFGALVAILGLGILAIGVPWLIAGIGFGVTLGNIIGGAVIGAVAIAGGAALMINGVNTLKDSKTSSSNTEQESLPYISGGQNTDIIGNRYPLVLGKHLINPYIIGTPYHITHVTDLADAEDGEEGQEFHALYTAGYGPLRLTNFKLGDSILAYNQTSEYGDRKCVLHGQLSGCDDADTETVGEITKLWKNNNVKLEILQAGSEIPLKSVTDSATQYYGTIYPQTVNEQEINANLLFIHDKAIQDVYTEYVTYKGASIPKNYRTNSVRFAAGCAKKIQVELDFPNGYFATRTYTNDNDSEARYYKIPLNVAVQWRFASANEDSSDADTPDGWTDFSYMVFDKGNIEPVSYSTSMRNGELEMMKGKTEGTTVDYNDNWINHKCFSLVETTSFKVLLTDTEIKAAIKEGKLTLTTETVSTSYTYEVDSKNGKRTNKRTKKVTLSIPKYVSSSSEYVVESTSSPYYWSKNYNSIDSFVKYNDSITTYKVYKYYTTPKSTTEEGVNGDNYNINERRYVFEYEFNDKEVRQMLNFGTGTDYLDNIEVRVIRLTPCYIDQTKDDDTSDKYSKYSYQDLVKWTYLRTWKFDKLKFQKALNDASKTMCYKSGTSYYYDAELTNKVTLPTDIFSGKTVSVTKFNTDTSDNRYYFDNSSTIKVDDYPERPFTESDMNKFCYIGLQLKQDVNNTAGSSLSQLSVVAEAFHPNYIAYDRYEVANQWDSSKKYYVTDGSYVKATEYDSKEQYYTKNGTDYELAFVTESAFPSGTYYYIQDYKLASPQPTETTLKNGTYYTLESSKAWYPQSISENWGYYHKYKDDFNRWKIDSITQSEYEEGVLIDSTAYYKQRQGSDYLSQIRKDIFNDMNNIERTDDNEFSFSPMFKYYISDDIIRRYITSNTASVAIYSLVGPQMGRYAKTYDSIALDDFAEAYEFYKDITDGSLQDISSLPDNYSTTAKLTLAARKHTGQEMITKDSSYSSEVSATDVVYYLPQVYTSGTKSWVLTPITSTGAILTKSQLKTEWQKLVNGKSTSYNVLMAYFSGGNSVAQANRYAKVANSIGKLVYESFAESDTLYKAQQTLNSLKTKPINAILDGVYEEEIYYIIELFRQYEEKSTDTYKMQSNYYSYVVNFIQQAELCDVSEKSEGNKLRHVSFCCNGVVTKEVKSENLLQQILLTGRSFVKRSDDNKWSPLIGRPNPYPVNVLNQRNCLAKSNSKSFDNELAGFQVSFVDASDNWSENDFYIMANGEDYTDPTKNITNLSISYVTDRYQMASLARFNLAAQLYQKEQYTRTVGISGFGYSLGDTVLLQDDSLIIGTDNGGRIVELVEDESYIYGFVTDEPFEYTAEVETDGDAKGKSVQGCTVVQPNQYKQSRCITFRLAKPNTKLVIHKDTAKEKTFVYKKGLTNIVLFDKKVIKATNHKESDDLYDGTTEFSVTTPAVDNLVAFGRLSQMNIKAVIMGISHKEKDQFELTLSPYNENLYNAGFDYPIFKSNMTRPALDDELTFNANITTAQLAERTSESESKSNSYADSAASSASTNLKDYIDNTAIPNANTYAEGVANTAQKTAISTAASDATTKANNAKDAAISAAASDASTKASNAETAAKTAAKDYADTAKTDAVSEAKDYADDIVAKKTIRTLISLTETGVDKEVALYNGWFYKYVDSKWQPVAREDYLGTLDYFPDVTDSTTAQFFLYTGTAKTLQYYLTTTKGYLTTTKGKILVNVSAEPNYIYYFDEQWRKVRDRNDYRYLIATNDLLANNGEISPNLDKNVQDRADTAEKNANAYTDKAEKNAKDYAVAVTPKFLGTLISETDIPSTPSINNYFLWNGDDVTTYVKGTLYKWTGSEWSALSKDDSDAYTYYMTALQGLEDTGSTTQVGAFMSVFCQTLVAQQAFIENLQTQQFKINNTWIQTETADSDKSVSILFIRPERKKFGYIGQTIGIGNNALQKLVNGSGNVAIGSDALINLNKRISNASKKVADGDYCNTALSHKALETLEMGNYNIGIGYLTGGGGSDKCISIGFNAGMNSEVDVTTINSKENIAIGSSSGVIYSTKKGVSGNICIGQGAGGFLANEREIYDNIFIGNGAGSSASSKLGYKNIMIGTNTSSYVWDSDNEKFVEGLRDNEVNIGNKFFYHADDFGSAPEFWGVGQTLEFAKPLLVNNAFSWTDTYSGSRDNSHWGRSNLCIGNDNNILDTEKTNYRNTTIGNHIVVAGNNNVSIGTYSFAYGKHNIAINATTPPKDATNNCVNVNNSINLNDRVVYFEFLPTDTEDYVYTLLLPYLYNMIDDLRVTRYYACTGIIMKIDASTSTVSQVNEISLIQAYPLGKNMTIKDNQSGEHQTFYKDSTTAIGAYIRMMLVTSLNYKDENNIYDKITE